MYCLFAYWPFCYIGNTMHPIAELGGLFVEASAIRCDRTIIYSLDGSLVTIIINIIWHPRPSAWLLQSFLELSPMPNCPASSSLKHLVMASAKKSPLNTMTLTLVSWHFSLSLHFSFHIPCRRAFSKQSFINFFI